MDTIVTSKTKHSIKKPWLKKLNITGWLFILPAVICAAVLRYFPLFKSFYLSFFKYDLVNPPGEFIGFTNYKNVLTEGFFKEACVNTFWFLALTILLTFFIPIIQAILLNEIFKGRKFFSTMYLLTAVIPISVNVVIWKWIWHPDYGVANVIVNKFGIDNLAWLSDPMLTKFCIVFPGILGGGTAILLYLAAILNIDSEIYEAAYIDGCSGFQKIFYIILPNIKFLIFIQMVFTVISGMQILDMPYQYTGGGPSGASTSVGIYIYKAFYQDYLVGKSNAAAFILFIVIAIMVFIQLKLDKTETE